MTDNLMLACPSNYLYSRRQEQIRPINTYEAMYGVEESDVEKFNTCNSTGKLSSRFMYSIERM